MHCDSSEPAPQGAGGRCLGPAYLALKNSRWGRFETLGGSSGADSRILLLDWSP